MFQWSQQKIDWYQQAAEHCGYHRGVAELVRRFLPDGSTAADLGCGLGYLSMELAPGLSHLTCVDISTEATAFLSQQCRRRGIGNLSVVCGDWTAWQPDKPLDAVVLSFVNGVIHQLPLLFQKSQGLVISVMPLSNHDNSSYGLDDLLPPRPRPQYRLRECWEDTAPVLEQRGIPYERLEFALPFGQWLADKAEVRAFFRHYYSMEFPEARLDEYLATRRQPGGGYYLDNTKRGCVVAIRRDQVPLEILEGAMD